MYKIFLCGLDNAGKTSITNTIKKLPNPGETTPTLNFNVAQVIIELTELVIFDAPGQTRFRDLWEDGLYGTQIICFIIDCSSPNRFEEAKEVLLKTLKDYEEMVPLIICFHKLDLPDAHKVVPQAKEIFVAKDFGDRRVDYLETTIFNPDSILALKTLFIKVIEEEM